MLAGAVAVAVAEGIWGWGCCGKGVPESEPRRSAERGMGSLARWRVAEPVAAAASRAPAGPAAVTTAAPGRSRDDARADKVGSQWVLLRALRASGSNAELPRGVTPRGGCSVCTKGCAYASALNVCILVLVCMFRICTKLHRLWFLILCTCTIQYVINNLSATRTNVLSDVVAREEALLAGRLVLAHPPVGSVAVEQHEYIAYTITVQVVRVPVLESRVYASALKNTHTVLLSNTVIQSTVLCTLGERELVAALRGVVVECDEAAERLVARLARSARARRLERELGLALLLLSAQWPCPCQ